jgi:hypothetical protein
MGGTLLGRREATTALTRTYFLWFGTLTKSLSPLPRGAVLSATAQATKSRKTPRWRYGFLI